MTDTVKFNKYTCHRCLLFFLFLATLTGCYNQPSSASQPEDGFLVKQSNVIFFASTPFDTKTEAEIYLDIVDDLTGFNLNPVRHKMQFVSENLYSLELSFPVNSMVKYRYALGSNPTTIEHSALGESIYYRVVNTQQDIPVVARDVIASWIETPLNISLGKAEGRLIDSVTGAGIPGLLVNLNGLQTTTSATGEFLLEKALPGKYLLTIYHLDGSYEPFQQEAIIAPESSTPVDISLKPSSTSQVTFIITPPSDHNMQASIRLIGNTTHLGNTFDENFGRTRFVAANAPVLDLQENGTYKISLTLPAGMDLRYKYTIGDGFWNAERHADGQFITRQLIVPDEDITINETIANWKAGDRSPIRFEVRSLPGNKIPEQLYIQLNSYTWAEPIPMWLDKENPAWVYEVYSPLYLFPTIGYRLCFDAQCNSLVDSNGSPEGEAPRISTVGNQFPIQITLPPNPNSTSELFPLVSSSPSIVMIYRLSPGLMISAIFPFLRPSNCVSGYAKQPFHGLSFPHTRT